MVDIDEYQLLLQSESPIRAHLGIGARPPIPQELITFKNRRERFERVIEKELNVSWENTLNEMKAKGQYRTQMENMIKPHLITFPAFLIAGQIGRTFNGELDFNLDLEIPLSKFFKNIF